MGSDANMPNEIPFTDEEILEQLRSLGFQSVTHEQLTIFKQELFKLLQQDTITASAFGLEQSDGDTIRKDTKQNNDIVNNPVIEKPQHVLIEKLGPAQERNFNSRSSSLRSLSSSASLSSLSSRRSMSSVGIDEIDSGTSRLPSTGSTEKPLGSRLSSCERPRKRKVLRRRNGSVFVSDETVVTDTCYSSSLSSDVKSSKSYNSHSEESTKGSIAVKKSSDGQNRNYPIKSQRKWRSTSDLNSHNEHIYKPKSVILPYYKESRTLGYFKTDPVALYHYYKKEWALHNIPGERDHRDLRWNIRSMMSVKDVFSRSQSRSSLMTT